MCRRDPGGIQAAPARPGSHPQTEGKRRRSYLQDKEVYCLHGRGQGQAVGLLFSKQHCQDTCVICVNCFGLVSLKFIVPFTRDCLSSCRWVTSLRNANMTVTTIQHYSVNVGCFIRYIAETPSAIMPPVKTALIGLQREMLSVRKSLKRGVAMHQTLVRADKEIRGHRQGHP